MKKTILVASTLLVLIVLTWLVVFHDWVLRWDKYLCVYQARELACEQASAPEYKGGRPKKFDVAPGTKADPTPAPDYVPGRLHPMYQGEST